MKTREFSVFCLFGRASTAATPHRAELPRLPVRFVERLESRIAPAFDAFITGGVVTFVGDGADDTLAFTTAVEATSGKVVLMHNRFSAGDRGFASDTDLDSGMAGIQSIEVTALTQVNVNAGGGNDTVKLGDDRSPASALPPAFMLDGGAGSNGIVIDWKSDRTGRAAAVTGNDITGISAAGGGAWNVARFARIDLFGGSGGDTFDVQSGPGFAPISILGGSGTDSFRIAGAADGSVFRGGPGADKYTAAKFEIGPLDLTITFDEEIEFIDSGDELTILGSNGDDTFALGLGGITADNSLHFNHRGMEMLAINAGDGNDVISENGELVPAVLDGQAGSDTYLIGLLRTGKASRIEINDTGANAAETDQLTLTGTAGPDTFMVNGALLTVNDSSNANDSLAVIVDGLEALSVFGGGDADTFFCQNNLVPGVLDGQGGGDTYGVTFGGRFTGPITIGDTGTDVLPDILTMLGTNGADTFVAGGGKVVFDQTQTLMFGAQGSGLEKATLNALGGSDEVSYGTGVYNTGLSGGVHTSLLGGLGTDSFTLNATPGPDDDVTLDGQSDSDTYAIHFGALTAPVTINDSGAGPAADNQIIAIGTAGSDNFTITAGQVVFQDEDKRPPQVVVYFGDIGNLKFEGVLGDDTFTVMKLGVPADLIGGGGADTFNILATDAPVTIDGQAGGDTIAIQLGALRGGIEFTDTGAPGEDRLFFSGTFGRDNFTVYSTRIDWSGPGDERPEDSMTFVFSEPGIEYLPAQIMIDARAGDDTLNVVSTSAGTSLLVEGGDGADGFEAHLPLRSGKVTLADHEFEVPGSVYDPDTIYAPDTLTVFGSNNDDEITVTDTFLRDPEHTLDFTGIDEIEILAGKGNDDLQFSNSALLPAVKKVRISGGDGDDTIRDSSGPGHGRGTEHAVIAIILEGDEGDDILTGGAFANTIGGGAGDDVINGGGGDDVIDGGGGDDFLNGGAGNDMLTGGLGANTIGGAAGIDTVIEVGDFDWTVTVGSIGGVGGVEKLSGVERAQITGGESANKIDATKFRGSVVLDGGAGNDTLLGGVGADTFIGGAGDDMIDGGRGRNTLVEAGDVDFTLVSASQIKSHGRAEPGGTLDGLGHDILMHIARVTLIGGDSGNVLDAASWRGPVTLRGMGGDDVLRGGSAADFLSGGLGSNTIGGGGGIDTVIEEGDADFTLSDTSLNGPGIDILDGIEVAMLTGGESDNIIAANTWTGRVILIGLGGDDHLTGGDGNDLLLGGDGDDVLIGGKGRDRLIGGAGKNTLTQ